MPNQNMSLSKICINITVMTELFLAHLDDLMLRYSEFKLRLHVLLIEFLEKKSMQIFTLAMGSNLH